MAHLAKPDVDPGCADDQLLADEEVPLFLADEKDCGERDIFVFDKNVPSVGWAARRMLIQETVGFVVLHVYRTGPLDKPLTVHYMTVDGTAKDGERFVSKASQILFPKGSYHRLITVRVLDEQYGNQEAKEQFWVQMHYPSTVAFSALEGLPPIVNPTVEIVVEDMDSFSKHWSGIILSMTWFQVLTVLSTAYALFGYEAILATDPYQSRDDYVWPLTIITIVFFMVEFALMCHSLGYKYVGAFMFFLDMACIGSLIMILPGVVSAYSALFGVGLSRSARVAKLMARAVRTLRCGAFMGKCFKLAVTALTAYQVHKLKNQLLDDVHLEEAKRALEEAEETLEASAKKVEVTSETLDDKEELMRNARTPQEKFGCEAQVFKWTKKLDTAKIKKTQAEHAVQQSQVALTELESTLLEKREMKEKKIEQLKERQDLGLEMIDEEEKVDFDDKTEQVTNAAADAVAKIGAALLEMLSSKMILMMLATLVCHAMLTVPTLEGAREQYGMSILYQYRTDISGAVDQYKRGSPLGSHFDENIELIDLVVGGVSYVPDLQTDKVDDYHWENMAFFTPDNDGYVNPEACDVEWYNIKQLKGSRCATYAIFSNFKRTRTQAINNIGFMFILLVIMVVGLGLMTMDFSKLLGDPVNTVMSLVNRLRDTLSTAVDQMHLFLVKIQDEEEETSQPTAETDPLAVLLKTNPHLNKFDPKSDTSKMDMETLEWHKNVMDQLADIKLKMKQVKVMADRYASMDVAEHATLMLADMKMISVGVNQEILDVLRECELSFAFRMSSARNDVVVEHERLVGACSELEMYFQQPTRTQVSRAFSTLGALNVFPEPVAKLVSITEKVITQALSLTTNEPKFDEILMFVLATLPPEWSQMVGVLPPKLVHAILTYPEGSSEEIILAEAKQHAPAELQPYLALCTPSLLHKLLTCGSAEEVRSDLEAVVAKVQVRFREDVGRNNTSCATSDKVIDALITVREAYQSYTKASHVLSTGSLPIDGAGADLLASVVKMVCSLLRDSLQDELGPFGMAIPKELPSDFSSLHQFALNTFMEVIIMLAQKHDLPLANADALKSFATGTTEPDPIAILEELQKQLLVLENDETASEAYSMVQEKLPMVSKLLGVLQTHLPTATKLAAGGEMDQQDLLNMAKAAAPSQWQHQIDLIPAEAIELILTYPALSENAIQTILSGACEHASPTFKPHLDVLDAEMIHKLLTAPCSDELGTELNDVLLNSSELPDELFGLEPDELLCRLRELISVGLIEILLSQTQANSIPEVQWNIELIPPILVYKALTAETADAFLIELDEYQTTESKLQNASDDELKKQAALEQLKGDNLNTVDVTLQMVAQTPRDVAEALFAARSLYRTSLSAVSEIRNTEDLSTVDPLVALNIVEGLMLEAMPPGYLSKFDRQLICALADGYRTVLDNGPEVNAAVAFNSINGPIAAKKSSSSFVQLFEHLVNESDVFPQKMFGTFDRIVIFGWGALRSTAPAGVSQQEHLLEQVRVMCTNEQLFPDGPPEQFLAACDSLSTYGEDVDPMIVIACDYLENVLDSGKITGTLDKLVLGALQKELHKIRTQGLSAFKTKSIIGKVTEMGKEQLKALGKGGGRWKMWRVGQAWNAWFSKTQEGLNQRQIARQVLSFLRSGGMRCMFRRWRHHNKSECQTVEFSNSSMAPAQIAASKSELLSHRERRKEGGADTERGKEGKRGRGRDTEREKRKEREAETQRGRKGKSKKQRQRDEETERSVIAQTLQMQQVADAAPPEVVTSPSPSDASEPALELQLRNQQVDDLVLALFQRYDLDNSNSINSSDEFEQLTLNLVFKLGIQGPGMQEQLKEIFRTHCLPNNQNPMVIDEYNFWFRAHILTLGTPDL